MNEKQRIRYLRHIQRAITAHTEKYSLDEQSIATHYMGIDGRTLRGLSIGGYITLTPQNNNAKPPYFRCWYDISLTDKGKAAISKEV